jgi:hypothetical protein
VRGKQKIRQLRRIGKLAGSLVAPEYRKQFRNATENQAQLRKRTTLRWDSPAQLVEKVGPVLPGCCGAQTKTPIISTVVGCRRSWGAGLPSLLATSLGM